MGKAVSKTPYQRYRFLLFLGVGMIFFGTLVYLAYRDFFMPPDQLVKQPEFTIPQVQSKDKTDKEKVAYTVPPTHPKNLIIEKLAINANIVPLGTLKNGALDAPKTAWEAGWYASSTQPGTGSGAVVLDGHVNDTLNTPGVFYKLHTLMPGDVLRIERGDNTFFDYRVKAIEQTSVDKLNMSRVLSSIEPTKEGLNIITCGGAYDRNAQTYTDRIVVYATRVQAP
jgi:LPXTG-site transpeptidase (sortase) family protein